MEAAWRSGIHDNRRMFSTSDDPRPEQMISEFMKEWWAKVFLCPKCKKGCKGGALQFDLCDTCYLHLKDVAAEMQSVSESYIARRDREARIEAEKRQYEMMVSAMKEAIRAILKEDQPERYQHL